MHGFIRECAKDAQTNNMVTNFVQFRLVHSLAIRNQGSQ